MTEIETLRELAVAREARDAHYAVVLALRSELAEAKAALGQAREPGAEFDRGFIAERERLRAALRRLIQLGHAKDCTESRTETCNCGQAEAVAALAAADRKDGEKT